MASRTIEHEHARKLHRMFKQQNKSHMMTHHGKPLKAFYVEREGLEEILKDPEVSGIHFYMGKHHEHQNTDDNVFTIIYIGSKPNPLYNPNVTGGSGKGDGGGTTQPPFIHSGSAYDYVSQCPDACGDLDPQGT